MREAADERCCALEEEVEELRAEVDELHAEAADVEALEEELERSMKRVHELGLKGAAINVEVRKQRCPCAPDWCTLSPT